MRIILLLTANLVILSVLLFNSTFGYKDKISSGNSAIYILKNIASDIKESAASFSNSKEINITGNLKVSKEKIIKSLPMERSVFWWLINQSKVEKEILNNTYIEGASVNICGYLKWGCFNISIKERIPSYIAILGDSPWLVGKDGGFITPLSDSKVQVDANDLNNSVMIKGILEKNYSPDILKAKLNFISESMKVIEQKLNNKVQGIEVKSDSEFYIKFKNTDYIVIFNFANLKTISIEDQAIRLKKILAQYKGRTEEIKQIDLAFDNMGVVQRKSAPLVE